MVAAWHAVTGAAAHVPHASMLARSALRCARAARASSCQRPSGRTAAAGAQKRPSRARSIAITSVPTKRPPKDHQKTTPSSEPRDELRDGGTVGGGGGGGGMRRQGGEANAVDGGRGVSGIR